MSSINPINASLQACLPSNVAPGGLKYLGNNQYETNRYLITVKKGEVEVFDKFTKTSVKAWGDPHVTTGDGDKMQFHKDNLTLDLKDGTKLTLKPTAVDANGVSLIDSLAIMTPKGGAELVENISTGPTPGKHFNSSLELDRLWQDGTVLRSGAQVDDLFYAANGKEIVGGDAAAKFGEHALDGKGGHSAIDFTNGLLQNPSQLPKLDIAQLLKLLQNGAFQKLPQFGQQGIQALLARIMDLIKNGGLQAPGQAQPGTPAPSAGQGAPGFPGVGQGFDGLRQLIAALIQSMQQLGQGGVNGGIVPPGLPGQLPSLPQLPGFRPGDFSLPTPAPAAGGSTGAAAGGSFKDAVFGKISGIDGQINAIKARLTSGEKLDPAEQQKLQFELQELLEQKKQLTEMLTNIMKSEHEMKMSVIRNLAV